jgi:hypothetical protein
LDEALARAREALAIDPSSTRARQLQEQALQAMLDQAPPRPTPGSLSRPQTSPRPRADAAVDSTVPRARRDTTPPVKWPETAKPSTEAAVAAQTAAPPWSWRSLRREQRWAIGTVAVLLLLAAAIAPFLLRQPAPAPSLVVIDAAPWARVVSVQGGGGNPQPLPEDSSTPLAIRLIPGTYSVVLQGPPPQSEQRTITVRVEPGVATYVPVEKFTPLSADEYFRPYITPPAPVAEPGARAQEASP